MNIDVEIAKTLSVARLAGPEDLDSLVAEWELLDGQIPPRSPFTSPLWIGLWWRHFRRRTPLLRDIFFCHAVRDAAGRLVAVVPLMLTHSPGIGVPAMRVAQFFGADPSLTEFRGVICRPEDHRTVVHALMEYFARHRSEWDLFRWNGLRHPASSYCPRAVGCDLIERRELADYVMELPRNWDELRARVSTNMRKNLRKAYEFLERDGFRFAVGVVEAPEEIEAAVGRFLSLHTARSQAAGMINHPDKFARPRERAFMVKYLAQLADSGRLRIFELELNGKIVASRLTFLLDDDLYLYFAGYDPIYRDYSIMTVLVAEIIKWAIARGLRHVNLSTGNDQSKLRWRPAEIVSHDALQVSPTARGRLAFRAFRIYEIVFQYRNHVARSA